MAFTQSKNFTANTPATAADQNDAWDNLEAYLNGNLSLSELVGGSSGQIAVVNGSCNLAIVTVGGVITIAANGTTSFVANSVGAAAIGTLPYCELTKSAAQTISSGSLTEITFDTEVGDTDTMHAGGNPSRITATTAGVYIVTGFVDFADSLANGKTTALLLRKNGTTYIAQQKAMQGADGVDPELNVALVTKLAATDYLELIVQHDAGSSKDIDGGDDGCRFSAAWIGDG